MESYDGGQSIELDLSCFRSIVEGAKVKIRENRMENFSFDFFSLDEIRAFGGVLHGSEPAVGRASMGLSIDPSHSRGFIEIVWKSICSWKKFIKCLKSIHLYLHTYLLSAAPTHTITQKRDSIDFDMENGKVHQEFFDL